MGIAALLYDAGELLGATLVGSAIKAEIECKVFSDKLPGLLARKVLAQKLGQAACRWFVSHFQHELFKFNKVDVIDRAVLLLDAVRKGRIVCMPLNGIRKYAADPRYGIASADKPRDMFFNLIVSCSAQPNVAQVGLYSIVVEPTRLSMNLVAAAPSAMPTTAGASVP